MNRPSSDRSSCRKRPGYASLMHQRGCWYKWCCRQPSQVLVAERAGPARRTRILVKSILPLFSMALTYNSQTAEESSQSCWPGYWYSRKHTGFSIDVEQTAHGCAIQRGHKHFLRKCQFFCVVWWWRQQKKLFLVTWLYGLVLFPLILSHGVLTIIATAHRIRKEEMGKGFAQLWLLPDSQPRRQTWPQNYDLCTVGSPTDYESAVIHSHLLRYWYLAGTKSMPS